jgi:hypothetical protein
MPGRRRAGKREAAEFTKRSGAAGDGRRDFLVAEEWESAERDAEMGGTAGADTVADHHVREEFGGGKTARAKEKK